MEDTSSREDSSSYGCVVKCNYCREARIVDSSFELLVSFGEDEGVSPGFVNWLIGVR